MTRLCVFNNVSGMTNTATAAPTTNQEVTMTRTTAAQLVSGNVVHLDGFAQPAAVIDARHEGGWTYVDVRPEGCYFPVMRRMTSGTPVTVIDPQLEALSALIAELSY